MKSDPLQALRDYLASLPAGPLSPSDADRVRGLLADSWYEFDGSGEAGMRPYKLQRMQDVTWHPPRLTFHIERHGAAVLGSIYAGVQQWDIDLDQMRATSSTVGHRQVSPKQAPFDVEPLADELARLIIEGQQDRRIRRFRNGRVQVLTSTVLPKASIQTTKSRSKRLRAALLKRLRVHGWSWKDGAFGRGLRR